MCQKLHERCILYIDIYILFCMHATSYFLGGVPAHAHIFSSTFGQMGMGLKSVGQMGMGLKTVKTRVTTKINITIDNSAK